MKLTRMALAVVAVCCLAVFAVFGQGSVDDLIELRRIILKEIRERLRGE